MPNRVLPAPLLACLFLTPHFAAAEPPAPEEIPAPTAEQLADLKTAVAEPGTYADMKLQRALALPENEGLALATVREARRLFEAGDRTNSYYNLMVFLSFRAGREEELHLDGPYLRPYAELLFEEVKESLAAETGWGPRSNYGPLHKYLATHPDAPLREPVLELARRYAPVASTYRSRDLSDPESNAADHRAASQYYFALDTLILLGEIREGMPLADLEKLLGGPANRTREDEHYWFLAVPFRKLYAVRANVDAEGKVTKIAVL